MSVIGVLVDAQVGHHHHPITHRLAAFGQSHLHNSLRGERLRADGVLGGRDAEQDERADAQVRQLADLGHEALTGVLQHARQRRDGLRRVDALADEQRGHHLPRMEPGLGHQFAYGRRRPESTRPLRREHR